MTVPCIIKEYFMLRMANPLLLTSIMILLIKLPGMNSQVCGTLTLERRGYLAGEDGKIIFKPTMEIPTYLLEVRKWMRNGDTVYQSDGRANDLRFIEDEFSNKQFLLTIKQLTSYDSGDYKMSCQQGASSHVYYTEAVRLVVKENLPQTTTSNIPTVTSGTSSHSDQSNNNDNSSSVIVPVVISVIVGLLVITVVVVLIVMKRRQQQPQKKPVRPTLSIEYSRRQSENQNNDGVIYNNIGPAAMAPAQEMLDADHYATCSDADYSKVTPRSQLQASDDAEYLTSSDQVEYAVAIPKSKRREKTKVDAEYSQVVPKSLRQSQMQESKSVVAVSDEQRYVVSHGANAEYSVVVPKSQRHHESREHNRVPISSEGQRPSLNFIVMDESISSRDDGQLKDVKGKRINAQGLVYAELEIEGSPPLRRTQVHPPDTAYSDIDFNTKAFVAPKRVSPVP